MIDLSGDWATWIPNAPTSVLAPEEPWEGADLPIEASVQRPGDRARAPTRDPAIFIENDRVWLLYAVAGESGIAIAEIHDPSV